MEKEKIKYETPIKPEMEDLQEIKPDCSEFEEPEKAKALIENLDLSIGDTIRQKNSYYENSNTYIINPRMVLSGNSPKDYEKKIENLKKILSDEEIKLISNYIKRKKENEKVRDKIYYSIQERTNKFYWRGKIKKSLSKEIKEILEFFKEDKFCGIDNLVFYLLKKEKQNFIYCYKQAWFDKKIPNIQEWKEKNDGEYKVLTNEEADREAENYLIDDPEMWKMAVESGRTEKGLNDWAKEVLNMNGRGNILSNYNSREEYEKINGTEYFIYRIN